MTNLQWTPLLLEFYHSLPKDRQDEWLEQRYLCDNSFYYYCLNIADSSYSLGAPASTDIHKPIMDFWQDPTIKRKGCAMGRAWRKSSYLTCEYSIWRYCQNHEIRILIASQKEDKSKEFVGYVKDKILSSQRLRYYYPELQIINKEYTIANPYSRKQVLLPRKGKFIEPTLQAIGITGGAQGGHYDLILPDDLIGEKGMESERIRADAMRWFDNVDELCVEKDHTKPNGSDIYVVGAHWANGDLNCYIQDSYPIYQWMIAPALKDSTIKNRRNIVFIQNPNVKEDESNWPEEHRSEDYWDMRANPEKRAIFYAQHQNNPRQADEFNKIDIEWLRYYYLIEKENEKYIKCEDDGEEFKISYIPKKGIIDPGGFAETEPLSKTSNNAILVAGQPYQTIKKFVLHTWAGKPKDPDVFVGEVFSANKEWNVEQWKIETYQAQEYIKRDLQKKARDKKLRFFIASLDKEVSKDAKHARIQNLIPVIKNGEIYVHRNMRKLIGEIEGYPSRLTKDLIDALAWWVMVFATRQPIDPTERDMDEPRIPEEGRSKITGYTILPPLLICSSLLPFLFVL